MLTSTQNIERLEQALASIDSFKCTIYFEQDECIKEAQITCEQKSKYIRTDLFESPGCLVSSRGACITVLDAFKSVANLLKGITIFPQTVVVESNNRAAADELYKLTRIAWCEVFECALAADDASDPQASRRIILQSNLWSKLTGGAEGIQNWNARPAEGAQLIDWSGSKLAHTKLDGVNFPELKLNASDFDGANLSNAVFFRCQLSGATFRGANLSKANMKETDLEGADFTNANLKQTKLKEARLRKAGFAGADISRADLSLSDIRCIDFRKTVTTDANFDYAQYDETTQLPPNFAQWSRLRWLGSGPDPYKETIKGVLGDVGVANFDQFIAFVKGRFDNNRMNNALKMLKKERFYLYAEVTDHGMMGVVKSEKDPEVVYGCSLAADGAFVCGTENLKYCEGARWQGEVCSHVLVLAIGLARAKKLDLRTATRWIFASKQPKHSFNQDVLPMIFLKYKFFTDGGTQIDWRPTETVPEDYYAF
jgi:uncharacterized protein YjbI with pentapeptide repeats